MLYHFTTFAVKTVKFGHSNIWRRNIYLSDLKKNHNSSFFCFFIWFTDWFKIDWFKTYWLEKLIDKIDWIFNQSGHCVIEKKWFVTLVLLNQNLGQIGRIGGFTWKRFFTVWRLKI